MPWLRISLIILLSACAGVLVANIVIWRKLRDPLNGPLCFDVPCAHFNARMPAIESVIAQQSGGRFYLALGDSITEFAELEPICGRKPLNAGIGWATSETFQAHGARLAALLKPDFIVVALGTNDAIRSKADFRERMTALLMSLKDYPVVVVPIPGGRSVSKAEEYNAVLKQFSHIAQPLTSFKSTEDGVHLAPSAYPMWRESIRTAAEQYVCPALR
jgi:lysophospholipase L1-like esterase